MQTTSELYKELLQSGAPFEWQLTINGDAILVGGALFDGGITGTLFPASTPTVGGCTARELDIDLLPADTTIPRMAALHLEFRLVDGEQQSEWISAGVFFIDTRSWDAQHEVVTIHGYDAMLKAEQQFIPTGEDSGEWPRTQQEVVEAIAERMGVELDERCSINADYMVGYPSDYTCRELLGFIAASHCGNWIISPAGKLLLVPLIPHGEPVDVVKMADLEQVPEFDAWTGVQYWFDDTNTYSAGDDTGRVLEIECPWATQEMADNALAMIQGHVYRPYTAPGAIIDPAIEMGDAVTVYGIESVMATCDITLGDACCADISAPAEEEIDHEYPYESPGARQTKRELTKLAEATASIKVGVDKIDQEVVKKDAVVAAINLSEEGVKIAADKIELDGAVTFQSFDSATQNLVKSASDDASAAKKKVESLEERANSGEFKGETGKAGADGEDAVTLRIESSRGTVFKNNSVSTVLSVVIYKGSLRITDRDTLYEVFGPAAYLEWSWQRLNETAFGTIVSTDSRIGNNGFTFTLSPEDVDTKVVFMCKLITD